MRIAAAVVILILSIAAVILFNTKAKKENTIQTSSVEQSFTESPQPNSVDITATFQIITKGITRGFDNSKYHQQSQDVFLLPDNPTVVHAKKSGVTWNDFFTTLPMKLTKDCLTTGDGEVLCVGSGKTLKFYINGNEDPDLLDREIKDGDKILIEFK